MEKSGKISKKLSKSQKRRLRKKEGKQRQKMAREVLQEMRNGRVQQPGGIVPLLSIPPPPWASPSSPSNNGLFGPAPSAPRSLLGNASLDINRNIVPLGAEPSRSKTTGVKRTKKRISAAARRRSFKRAQEFYKRKLAEKAEEVEKAQLPVIMEKPTVTATEQKNCEVEEEFAKKEAPKKLPPVIIGPMWKPVQTVNIDRGPDYVPIYHKLPVLPVADLRHQSRGVQPRFRNTENLKVSNCNKLITNLVTNYLVSF